MWRERREREERGGERERERGEREREEREGGQCKVSELMTSRKPSVWFIFQVNQLPKTMETMREVNYQFYFPAFVLFVN